MPLEPLLQSFQQAVLVSEADTWQTASRMKLVPPSRSLCQQLNSVHYTALKEEMNHQEKLTLPSTFSRCSCLPSHFLNGPHHHYQILSKRKMSLSFYWHASCQQPDIQKYLSLLQRPILLYIQVQVIFKSSLIMLSLP